MEKDDEFIKEIDSRVKRCLDEAGFVPGDVVCAGVSGGADSMCLLTSLVSVLSALNAEAGTEGVLHVVSVNHRIRSEKESFGDCEYVGEYCASLSCKNVSVQFTCVSLEEGEVARFAERRARGIEDAARFLRYSAFEKYCLNLEKNSGGTQNKKIFFALAHTKNDQLETLIMRFLQGADGASRAGIAEKRTVSLHSEHSQKKSLTYIRPLLDTERSEIERYLNIKRIPWRTDSTNRDNRYLRNRIRNSLVPVLNSVYPGWKSSLLSGREKAVFENAFIEPFAEKHSWQKTDGGVFIDKTEFYSAADVIKERLVYRAFELMKIEERIPFLFVKKIMFLTQKIRQNGLEAFCDEKNLFIKKIKNEATISGFFAIIEKDCSLEFDFGTLFVKSCAEDSGFAEIQLVTNDAQNHYLNEKIKFPFCFRSRQTGDFVRTKSGGTKSVSDILSDFKVEEKRKNAVPVVQSLDGGKNILAVWGSAFGYRDWIVKDLN